MFPYAAYGDGMTNTTAPAIPHYSDCTTSAIGCAVQNVRDAILGGHRDYEGMSAERLIEYLIDAGAEYQSGGLMSCDCASRRLRATEARLRTLNKAIAYNERVYAGFGTSAANAGMIAERDQLRASELRFGWRPDDDPPNLPGG